MRDLKFRAWCLDNKWMEECFYLQAHNGVTFDVPSKTYDTPNIEIEESPNLVVMQFTGLTDKNGVDIYEGDICVSTYGDDKSINSQVKYCEANLSFWFLELNEPVCDYMGWQETIEVIGNIHQNPELLK